MNTRRFLVIDFNHCNKFSMGNLTWILDIKSHRTDFSVFHILSGDISVYVSSLLDTLWLQEYKIAAKNWKCFLLSLSKLNDNLRWVKFSGVAKGGLFATFSSSDFSNFITLSNTLSPLVETRPSRTLGWLRHW